MHALEQRPATPAIIFSSHNRRYYQDTIVPKLERYNIQPVRVIDPNKSSVLDFSGAGLVLILLELMDSLDVKRIREAAKKAGKQVLALHRQLSDWDRALSNLGMGESQRTASVTPITRRDVPSPTLVAPTPSTVPVVEEEEEPAGEPDPSKDYAEFLAMYEEENEELIKKNRSLEADIEHHRTLLQSATASAVAFEEQVKKLQADLISKRGLVELRDSANKKLVDEKHDLEARLSDAVTEVKKLKDRLSGKQEAAPQTDLNKALAPIRELWKMKYISAEKALELIFKE